MNGCPWDDRLQDLFDGVLPPDEEEAAAVHLHDCEVCAAAWDELTALRAAAADLPSSIDPPRSLWPGIADRLGDGSERADADDDILRPRFGLGRHVRLAAAAVALFALLAGWRLHQAPLAPEPYADLADGYDVVRADCRTGLAARGDELPTETRTAVDEGLALIDTAIRETQSALDKVSAAPEQANHLIAGYHRKMDLLKRLAHLASR